MGKEEAETGEDKNEEPVETEETKEEVEESVETEDNSTTKFDLDVIENILINTMNWKMEYVDGVIDELGITDRELYPHEVD